MTAEPGSLLNAVSALVKVEVKKWRMGSSVVDVEFMAAAQGKLWNNWSSTFEISHGESKITLILFPPDFLGGDRRRRG